MGNGKIADHNSDQADSLHQASAPFKRTRAALARFGESGNNEDASETAIESESSVN
jgi:hypothetical protein